MCPTPTTAAIVPRALDGDYLIFDPCIWKEDDGYYSLSGVYMDGSRGVDCRGVDHIFYSKDLAEWEWLGPMVADDVLAEPGEDMAVPNFWPIGNGRHMLLLFSHKRAGRYYIGHYDKTTHRFTPETHGRMNYGPWTIGSLHAPSATIDAAGRYLGLFNVKEGPRAPRLERRHDAGRGITGWRRTTHCAWRRCPSWRRCAIDEQQRGPLEIPANEELLLEGIGGQVIEIEAVIEPGDALEFGLNVLRAPDGAEQTRISWYPWQYGRHANPGWLQIDPTRSSLAADVHPRPPETGPLTLADG